jgi:hypothetical protein
MSYLGYFNPSLCNEGLEKQKAASVKKRLYK